MSYCQSLDCSVVYNSFFDTILLAVCKLVIIKIDCSTTLFVIGVAENQIDTTDCTEGKENNSNILKKGLLTIWNNKKNF